MFLYAIFDNIIWKVIVTETNHLRTSSYKSMKIGKKKTKKIDQTWIPSGCDNFTRLFSVSASDAILLSTTAHTVAN